MENLDEKHKTMGLRTISENLAIKELEIFTLMETGMIASYDL